MPCSGCSALHGMNPNVKKKKKKTGWCVLFGANINFSDCYSPEDMKKKKKSKKINQLFELEMAFLGYKIPHKTENHS